MIDLACYYNITYNMSTDNWVMDKHLYIIGVYTKGYSEHLFFRIWVVYCI